MDVNVLITIILGILLFIIGFLLGRQYNHLKRKEILHVHNRADALTQQLHDVNLKIGELEKQKDSLKHEKEERLKKWMDSTNHYKIKPVKK